ncbi:serine hydrolase domain-containing protein [uncultured Croceitalea sp.]|uniref:serine hydrolase domain-containing protein n=1 Tax=uncultured Croceitalea sp. TaxID=1798908 RepID=UPI0033064C02
MHNIFKIITIWVLSFASVDAQNVDSLLTEYSTNGRTNGIKENFNGVVLIANHNSIVFSKAYGYSNLEAKNGLKTDDKFLIGSVTKPIVALLVLKEVEKGSIKLNQSITEFLPYFDKKKGGNITIHNLLSHTGGISHYNGLVPFIESQEAFFESIFTPDEYSQLINKTGLVSIPNEKFNYSSLGYILLGAILEKVTNKTFSELIESEIAKPLALKNTGFSDNNFIEQNLVKNYKVKKSRYREFSNRNQSNTYTAGGIHSNAKDLFSIVNALKNEKLLNKELTEKIFTPILNGYSYGWFRNDPEVLRYIPKARFYAHGGRVNNYSSYIMLNDDGTTIIMLSNTTPLNPWKLISNTYRAYKKENLNKSNRVILPSLKDFSSFNEEGGKIAVKDYQKVMSKNASYPIFPSSSYLIKMVNIHKDKNGSAEIEHLLDSMTVKENPKSEDLLNRLAYLFLEIDSSKSKKYFMKATEMFPKSANAWDGLGEYYETIKDTKKAKKAYKKAVTLSKKYCLANKDLFIKNLERVTNEK